MVGVARRRTAAVLVASLASSLLVVAPQTPAAALCGVYLPDPETGSPGGTDCLEQQVTALMEMSVALSLTVGPNGVIHHTYGAAEGTVTTVTADGLRRVRDVQAEMPAAGDESSPGGSGYACVKYGDRRNEMRAYAPHVFEYDDGGTYASYVWHPYTFSNSRIVNGKSTWQAEVCLAGGAIARNGWRLLLIGGGETLADETRTDRIGWAWESGKDLPNVQASLGFQLGYGGSGVSASMSQAAVGENKGQLGYSPLGSSMDRYRRNAVHGYWEAVCGQQTPIWSCGSRNWQSSVTQALYEFYMDDPTTKTVGATWYGSRRCTTTRGCPS